MPAHQQATAYARILVAFDSTATSRAALGEAARLASAVRARIRLLHVVEEAIPGPTRLHTDDAEHYHWSEALWASRSRMLEAAAASLLEAGVLVELSLRDAATSSAADLILAEARQWKADLLVLGTHGRSGLARWLLGSTAEAVLRRAVQPVLLIHGPDDGPLKPPPTLSRKAAPNQV